MKEGAFLYPVPVDIKAIMRIMNNLRPTNLIIYMKQNNFLKDTPK